MVQLIGLLGGFSPLHKLALHLAHLLRDLLPQLALQLLHRRVPFLLKARLELMEGVERLVRLELLQLVSLRTVMSSEASTRLMKVSLGE